jgi:hypothetical protein
MRLHNRLPPCIGLTGSSCHVSSTSMVLPLVHTRLRPCGHVLPRLWAPTTSSSSLDPWPPRHVTCYASSTKGTPEASYPRKNSDRKRTANTSEDSGSKSRLGRGGGSSWGERGRQSDLPPRKRLFGGSEADGRDQKGPARSQVKELLDALGLQELKVGTGSLA